MSSPEVERFELTEEDYADEFNPNRRRFKLSKNKQTYGIWAEDSDEDERPHFGGSGGGGRKNKDYTTPMSFVSGGVKVGDKVSKEGDELDDLIQDSDEELEKRQREEAEQRKYGKKKRYQGRSVGGNQKDHSFGNWEAHTKGIGQKLLAQMGYKPGQGLGKNLQGINAPVEAFVRKGRAAVGAYGSEAPKQDLRKRKPDSEEDEDAKFQEELKKWKRKDQGDGKKKKKIKYVYKTAEELLKEGPTARKKGRGEQSTLSKVKVIDMTGREQRVLSGYHAIAHKHDIPDDDLSLTPHKVTAPEERAFDMPELLHNLDLLVDMAEDEIIQNDRKLRFETDSVVNIKHEKERMDDLCQAEEKHVSRLQEVLNIVEECETRSLPGAANPISLQECAQVLTRLQTDFKEEYKMYDLWAMSIALVFPLMKREFENWDPISKPRHGLVTIKEWKSILEEPVNRPYQAGEAVMEPYERLMWEVWMPHMRKAFTNNFNVRHPDPLIEVLEAWLPLTPDWVLANILDQLVYPSLTAEVENWNPLTDTMPIHAWIHPWLPLMKDRLEPLYAPIRHKLAKALLNWHPSDVSAKLMLEPWKGVFRAGHMDAFVVKNILPKLQIALQDFVINPHQQHLDAWKWVMTWLELLPIHHMNALLLKHFFRKWIQVLCQWLGNNPNFDEVSKWYSGWKSMFADVLLSQPAIKDEFNKALSIMNRAASGNWVPNPRDYMPAPAAPPPSTSTTTPLPGTADEKQTLMGARGLTASSSVPSSFKDLVERKAEENNLVFLPIPNRTWEAKQVYRFGSVQIYLDRGVLFIFDGGMWAPTSLSALVLRAKLP